MENATNDSSAQQGTTTNKTLHQLMTAPQLLFTHFCENHQLDHPNVALATLLRNNMMQSDFLRDYYETVIQPYTRNPTVEEDEDFMALLAFYTDHMSNMFSTQPFNINNGKGQTTNVREARTASFEYCMELLPQIQNKLLMVND